MSTNDKSLEAQLTDLILKCGSCLRLYREAASIGKKKEEENLIRGQIYIIKLQLSSLEHDIMVYHDPVDDIPF